MQLKITENWVLNMSPAFLLQLFSGRVTNMRKLFVLYLSRTALTQARHHFAQF